MQGCIETFSAIAWDQGVEIIRLTILVHDVTVQFSMINNWLKTIERLDTQWVTDSDVYNSMKKHRIIYCCNRII